MYRGKGKKLLQLRVSGILLSSHQHKPPFFRFPPPLRLFIGGSGRVIYLGYDVIAKWNKKIFDNATELCYNSQRKIMKNLLKFIIMLLRKIEKILQKTGK